MKRHLITCVAPGSIGESLEIVPGDFLLEIDGAEVVDVFDYRMAVASEELTLLIEKGAGGAFAEAAAPPGEIWELDIEKDADADLGLSFATPLMDEVRQCCNRCIFCFIDQQPPGLRDSLYVKDDDPRLSFLHGNYVTLTNADAAEIERIARHRFSPLRISVHTLDAALRGRMMGVSARRAGGITAALARFHAAGIEMHFQVVLCKGINDGARLDATIAGLLAYRPGAASLAVVPAGVTRYRGQRAAGGLVRCGGAEELLMPFSSRDAAALIAQVAAWQEKCRAAYGTAFVFAADEWYVLAGRAVPGDKDCEDFPQLENGVGMCALFARGFAEGLRARASSDGEKQLLPPHAVINIGIVTGMAAAGFMRGLAQTFEAHHPAVRLRIYPIANRFFGETVTVSGLLTGGDVIAQMRGRAAGLDVLFLPANAFRAGTEEMLDGTARAGLEAALNIPVRIGSADGKAFFRQLSSFTRE